MNLVQGARMCGSHKRRCVRVRYLLIAFPQDVLAPRSRQKAQWLVCNLHPGEDLWIVIKAFKLMILTTKHSLLMPWDGESQNDLLGEWSNIFCSDRCSTRNQRDHGDLGNGNFISDTIDDIPHLEVRIWGQSLRSSCHIHLYNLFSIATF